MGRPVAGSRVNGLRLSANSPSSAAKRSALACKACLKRLFFIHQQASRVPQPRCVVGELRQAGNRVGGQAVFEVVELGF